jgi:diguanylate cyclase (GGDEF)-like protein
LLLHPSLQPTAQEYGIVISLKKYLDMEIRESHTAPDADERLHAGLDAYRSTLLSMAESGARACPASGAELQRNLTNLSESLLGEITAPLLAETGKQASEQLQHWGDRTAEYLKARTAEVKELLIVLAGTAESVGERDQKYTDHFNQFTTRLRTISNLEDLTQVRASLVEQATELKSYVQQMEVNSHQLLEKLQTEVSTYETKLKQVEELALRDGLTGLSNRRNLEERIEDRIARGEPFCVLMVDLNRLKLVNDQHGHLAGDNLLQQFAQELRSSSRSSDPVGRWGGDEFVVVMDGDANGARAQVERLKKWVFGEYTVRPGKGSAEVKVKVDAAVGLAQWQPGETMKSVVERADAEMYKQKEITRKQT